MIQIFYLIFIDAPKEDLLSDRGRRQWGGGGGGACTTVRLDTELCTGRPTGLTTRLALRCWKVMNVMFGSYIYIYIYEKSQCFNCTMRGGKVHNEADFSSCTTPVWSTSVMEDKLSYSPFAHVLSPKASLRFHCMNTFLDSHWRHCKLRDEPAAVVGEPEIMVSLSFQQPKELLA